MDSEHLKSIDVICLDSDGSVKARFDEFFEFNYYKFKNGDILDYALGLKKVVNDRGVVVQRGKSIVLDKLEEFHEEFINM